MTDYGYDGPCWQKWNLTADPRMVWIPLYDGQVCGIMAHHWDLDGSEARFFVAIETGQGPDRLEVASFPKGLLADDETLRASLAGKELGCDNSAGRNDVLVSPPGSRVLLTGFPEFEAWPTALGLEFHVLQEMWARQGPDLCFGWLIRGWPEGSIPVCVDYLRLPVSILPEDRRDWMAIQW